MAFRDTRRRGGQTAQKKHGMNMKLSAVLEVCSGWWAVL